MALELEMAKVAVSMNVAHAAQLGKLAEKKRLAGAGRMAGWPDG